MKAPVFIFLFFISAASLAQSIIQGHVIAGDTNKPLPGATVFIANTSYGLNSGVNGEFMIKGLTPAHYKLVISFIGYETQVLDVLAGEPKTYKVILTPATKELDQFVIHGNRKRSHTEWFNNYKIFRDRFIGLSENSKFCEFENVLKLSFDNKDGVLKAYADSTLVLVNKGLGYRISILLEKYEFNFVTRKVHYEGQIVYDTMKPENERQKREWAEARLKAYYGSEMHFLRSLYERDCFKNGFYFNLIDARGIGHPDSTMGPRSPVFNNKVIKVLSLKDYRQILDSARSTWEEPVLSYKGDLQIQYINEAEPYAYQTNRHLWPGKNLQTSTIILLKPCIIESLGQVYPQDAIETKHYWTWELMAESLPLNYDPAKDLAITHDE